MPRWIVSLLGWVGLQVSSESPVDRRLGDLDRRSKTAVGKAAEKLNDDDLRRLAALDIAVSIHERKPRRAAHR